MGGRQLFMSITAWVVLHQSKRFTGALKGIVERLRVGESTQSDSTLINERVVGEGSVDSVDGRESTLVVLRNIICCKLSVPLAAAACARHGC